jgi:hypothetical protein
MRGPCIASAVGSGAGMNTYAAAPCVSTANACRDLRAQTHVALQPATRRAAGMMAITRDAAH